MDKLIKKTEHIDLSGSDILRMVDNKARVIAYHELEKYASIDDVLSVNGAVIILYQTTENYGHWVCLFKIDDSKLEFFDSLGLSVDAELLIAPEFNKSMNKGKLVYHLSKLIEQSNYTIVNNKTKLQKFAEDINTCGRFVVTRIIFRRYPISVYVHMMTKNQHYNADEWVSVLTILK